MEQKSAPRKGGSNFTLRVKRFSNSRLNLYIALPFLQQSDSSFFPSEDRETEALRWKTVSQGHQPSVTGDLCSSV